MRQPPEQETLVKVGILTGPHEGQDMLMSGTSRTTIIKLESAGQSVEHWISD